MNNNYGPQSATGIHRSASNCASTTQQQQQSPQFDPFMLGRSRGFGVGSSTPQEPVCMIGGHINKPGPPAVRTFSLQHYNKVNTSVGECMYWPASLNPNAARQQAQQGRQGNSYQYHRMANSSQPNSRAPPSGGDFQFCQAPPKVYLSAPGAKKEELVQQNIPCQIAPLGTDPMSMIKPLEPLTVHVQAPANLFAGDSSQPKTIAISPSALYGTGTGSGTGSRNGGRSRR